MRASVAASWIAGAAVWIACVGDAPVENNAEDGGNGGADSGALDAGSLPETAASDSQGSDVVECTGASTCPAATPNCQGGLCGLCVSGSDSDCKTYHSSTPKCGPKGACVECTAPADCTAKTATPFCGPNNTCVACLTANDCAPHVCGSDNVCRACQTNAECPAGACGDDGKCVAATNIAYVDNGNMAPAACRSSRLPANGQTPATAYCDIADALGGKPYIVVTGHGVASPYSPFGTTGTVTIIGPGYTATTTAVVKGAISGALVAITTPGASPGVTIDGLEITSALQNTGGVTCTTSGAGHAFRIRNTWVHDNNGDAIFNTGCDMTIEDSKVSGSDQHAVYDSNSPSSPPTYIIRRNIFTGGNADGLNITANVTFDRNIVANYTSGNGLQVWQPPYQITNSFIYLCRSGVEFAAIGTGTRIFEFNTIVNNTNNAFSGGCDSASGAAISRSIVVGNGDAPNSLSGCTANNVVTGDAGAPAFVNDTDPSKFDFHLATDTAAHLAANDTCCIDKVPTAYDAGAPMSDHDYDGTTRPKGPGYDIGAHEAK
jgi:hypothetical protein